MDGASHTCGEAGAIAIDRQVFYGRAILHTSAYLLIQEVIEVDDVALGGAGQDIVITEGEKADPAELGDGLVFLLSKVKRFHVEEGEVIGVVVHDATLVMACENEPSIRVELATV